MFKKDMIFNMIKYYSTYLLLSFGIIFMLFVYLTYDKYEKIDISLERNQNQFIMQYDIQKQYLNNLVQGTFFSVINKQNLTNTIKLAFNGDEKTKAIYANKLFNEFNPDFQRMKNFGLTQVKFYLPDNSLLLQMDDKQTTHNRKEISFALSKVNKTLNPVSTFKVDSDLVGFRYFFPLFDNNLIHVGNVELCNSSSSFKKRYEENNNLDLNFLVDKDIVKNKMSKSKQSNFRISHENSLYLIKKGEHDFTNNYLSHIFYTKTEKDNMKEKMLLGKLFTIYKKVDSDYLVITFLPIKNINGITNSAYLVIYKSSSFLKHMNSDYFNLIFFLFIISIILLFVFIRAFKNHKNTKQNELMMIQQSKMASIGEMLENIAHQWRQPLSLISTSASGMLVQREYGLLKDEEISPNLQKIVDATQYLSQTIDDFRKILKKEHKQEKFVVKMMIDSVLKLFGKAFLNKNIHLIKHIEDVEVISYQNELQQVIINIIKNAKDAIEQRKVDNNDTQENIIMITTKQLNEDNVLIKIQDSGGGIPENVIEKIFEPYFTTKHQSSGTGIGLYMSYNIIVNILHSEVIVKNENFSYNFKNYFGASFSIILHNQKEEKKDEE